MLLPPERVPSEPRCQDRLLSPPRFDGMAPDGIAYDWRLLSAGPGEESLSEEPRNAEPPNVVRFWPVAIDDESLRPVGMLRAEALSARPPRLPPRCRESSWSRRSAVAVVQKAVRPSSITET